MQIYCKENGAEMEEKEKAARTGSEKWDDVSGFNLLFD